MNKALIIFFIWLIPLATPLVVADSAVTMDATISDSIYVNFNFVNIEPELYDAIQTQGFDVSTIPTILIEDFEQNNLTSARVIYDINQEIFNDDLHSIRVKFHVVGSDIIGYVLNETSMMRTFRVRTDWRNFEVSFTQDFSLDLEEAVGAPLLEWRQVNNGGFERSVDSPFEMLFQFLLPEGAADVRLENDIIIFDLPLAFEDRLLNSPFLVLGAVVIATIIAVAYRRARK